MSLRITTRPGLLLAFCLIAVTTPTPVIAEGVLIPVPNRRDLIWDADRGLLYITTDIGRIERYLPFTQTLITPYIIDASLNGGDIDVAGDYLYVADDTAAGGEGFVHRVDLDTGASTTLAYELEFGEVGTWDVCIADNGLALVSTRFGGSGWVPLRELDLATGMFTIRTDVTGGDVRQNTHLIRGTDRSLILLMESNTSAGPIHLYRAATDSFVPSVNTGEFLSNAFGGVNYDATQVTVEEFNDIVLRGPTLAGTDAITGTSGAHVHDPLVDIIYAIDTNTDEIIAIQHVTREELYRLPIGEDLFFPAPFEEGQMVVNHTGTRLFVATDMGVRQIDLPYSLARDCDGNFVPDLCDLDCSRTDPNLGMPCTSFATCGTASDCTANFRLDVCEPDCNSNGQADSCDIAGLVSADCTDNGIPDECEDDCDGNGLPDVCEIDADPSLDQNDNGVSDACECLAVNELKLYAGDGVLRDRFGTSLALLDNETVIGAYNTGNTGPQSTGRGSVYVNEYDGETWDFQPELEDSSGQLGDGLGISVAAAQEVIVAGAAGDDENLLTDNGSAVIFRRTEGGWQQEQKVTGSMAGNSAVFGFSVSIDRESGARFVVGAVQEGTTGPTAFDGIGAAYVFVDQNGTWTEEARLAPADGTPNLFFGWSTSISGDVAVVSAHRDDTACPANINCNSGAAYVYRRVEGTWTFSQKITAPDLAEGDEFATSVSVSGDLLAIGSPRDDDGASAAGSVYVYRQVSGTWEFDDKLVAPTPANGDQFGISVAAQGDLLIVGATGDDEGGSNFGAAYLFARQNETWSQVDKIIASDGAGGDNFGFAVALGNGRALIGADGDDDRGSAAGAAYLYEGVTHCLPSATAGACCTAVGCTDVASAAACQPFICHATLNEAPACGGPCGTICWGDVDGNGFVNAGDRGFISAAIGMTDPATICQYDLDGNGFVNAGDRGFVSAHIGLCPVLPDYQNGSGQNGGAPDTRFGEAVFQGAGTNCVTTVCE